jgi:hypothetical protein
MASLVVWLTFRAHPRRLRRASDAAGVGCSALLAGLSAIEPAFEGRLRFARTPTGEKPFNADVFIKIRPVNALPVADEPPPRPLGIAAVCQPRVPNQGNTDRPAINQVDNQRIGSEPDPLRTRLADLSRS